MFDDDDELAGDLLFFAAVLAGGYIVLQYMRNREAAADGFTFSPLAPEPDTATEYVLNVLVPFQLSPTGAAFIKGKEGFRERSYADGGGRSIGYGHQIQPGENIIEPITLAEGEALFAADAARFSEGVAGLVAVQISQSQFDALVSLAYNIGLDAFARSTLLQLLNAGDYAGAADQFARWVYSDNAVNPVLQSRRADEAALFQQG